MRAVDLQARLVIKYMEHERRELTDTCSAEDTIEYHTTSSKESEQISGYEPYHLHALCASSHLRL